MERLTNQKQIILDYLQSVHTHPTAEEIFKAVQKKLPRISLATVYRNLEKFVEKEMVLEIPGETKRFDADIDEHQHFICDSCGKVYDICCRLPHLKKLEEHQHKVGTIKRYQLYFCGTCKKCKE